MIGSRQLKLARLELLLKHDRERNAHSNDERADIEKCDIHSSFPDGMSRLVKKFPPQQ